MDCIKLLVSSFVSSTVKASPSTKEVPFSFTLENDVYCRYLCFKTAEQFKATLVDRLPFKIDIGAVFNIQPDRHNTSDKKAFVPMHKEMVFDIDMDVYDDVRSCCKGA